MIDAKALLDQVLGGNAAGGLRNAGQMAKDRLNQAGGVGSFAGGAAAGGLVGLLLGNKSVRKMAGGAMGYGGAAMLGALALQAYQSYRAGQAVPSSPSFTPDQLARVPQTALPHEQAAADGRPFQLVLIESMIGAAKADGHVDATEQTRLFSEVERLGLDPESKALVFDLLAKPTDLSRIASSVVTPEQGAEVYLASRMAINPDHPAERAYLDALAARLKLPAELRAHLDAQSA